MSSEWTVIRTVSAWDLIGFDCNDGRRLRIVGGRTLYQAALYNDATARSDNVKLAYLATDPLREVSRYVDPDTLIEVVSKKPSSDA